MGNKVKAKGTLGKEGKDQAMLGRGKGQGMAFGGGGDTGKKHRVGEGGGLTPQHRALQLPPPITPGH